MRQILRDYSEYPRNTKDGHQYDDAFERLSKNVHLLLLGSTCTLCYQAGFLQFISFHWKFAYRTRVICQNKANKTFLRPLEECASEANF